jgi:hypothetical protein
MLGQSRAQSGHGLATSKCNERHDDDALVISTGANAVATERILRSIMSPLALAL